MNLTAEQFAELLAGITRAQQAVIDAIESESAGWRTRHLLPKLSTASNMRMATPRLIDVPSRVLLRSQGRVPLDAAAIARMLHEAVGGVPPAPGSSPVAAETGEAAKVPAAVPVAAAAAAATAVAASTGPAAAPAPSGAGDDFGNFFDT